MGLRRYQRVEVKPGLTLAEVPALIGRLQDAIEEALSGMAASPVANAGDMTGVELVAGDNTIRHTLGRVPRGVFPSDSRVTVTSVSESSMVLSAVSDLTCSLLLL